MEKYFKSKGFVYGVSSKFAFGRWNRYAIKFTNYEQAIKWLNKEEYDFRERELCSRTKAIKLCGKSYIRNIEES